MSSSRERERLSACGLLPYADGVASLILNEPGEDEDVVGAIAALLASVVDDGPSFF